MSQAGYLYVLANSSMPGIVKVGMTTRNPSERADELAKVTGVPTPFIIVFEQLFQDCTAAEQFVHTLLESHGFRVAQNREFFNAPVSEVVRAIMAAPGAVTGGVRLDETFHGSSDNDGDNDEDYEDDDESAPWATVYRSAEDHYYGHDDVLEDHREALKLYKQAARLGCIGAYAKLGEMFECGEGTSVDKDEAISYFKEGAKRGHQYCYWRLALLFAKIGNIGNSDKCAREFLNEPWLDAEKQDAALAALSHIAGWTGTNFQASETLKRMLVEKRDLLRVYAERCVKDSEKVGNLDMADYYKRRILDYIDNL